MERIMAQSWRRAARSSASPIASTSSASFSSTPIPSVARKVQRLRDHRRRLEHRKNAARDDYARTRPDPVLGYATGTKSGSRVWEECELRKLIVDREDVWSGKAAEALSGKALESIEGQEGAEASSDAAEMPALLNFGLDPNEASVLLDRLPAVSAQRTLLSTSSRDHSLTFRPAVQKRMDAAEAAERKKAGVLAKVVDLRNADSKGIERFNVAKIVDAFSHVKSFGQEPASLTPKKDVGCPEVQAAVLTYRIHYLVSQLRSNITDIHNRRVLTRYVMQRKHVLSYLKRKDEDRYDAVLPRLGLSPRAVEGEITIRKGLPPAPNAAKY